MEPTTQLKLNIGCGTDIRPGYVNMDSVELPGVDLVHDIGDLPLPFEANSVDEILCISILEHVDSVAVLRDLHRILRPTGSIKIVVPHFSAPDAFRDPTHVRYFTAGYFDFFVAGHKRDYYFDFHFSHIRRKLVFEKRKLFFYNYFLEWVVNLNHDVQSWYEKTPLRAFPALAVEAVLVK